MRCLLKECFAVAKESPRRCYLEIHPWSIRISGRKDDSNNVAMLGGREIESTQSMHQL